MLSLLNWLLRPSGYFLTSGAVIDDLVSVAIQHERERTAYLVADAEQRAQEARDWALLHTLEELGPLMEPLLRRTRH